MSLIIESGIGCEIGDAAGGNGCSREEWTVWFLFSKVWCSMFVRIIVDDDDDERSCSWLNVYE